MAMTTWALLLGAWFGPPVSTGQALAQTHTGNASYEPVQLAWPSKEWDEGKGGS